MRNVLIIAVLSLLLPPFSARSAEMIVTKKGQSVRVKEVKQEGERFIYVDEETGAKHVLLVSDVDTMLPLVVSGQTYTPAEINTALEKIEEIKPRHMNMVKKLNIIAGEWQALLQVDPDLKEKVDLEVRRVSASNTLAVYQRASMNLQMLKFKNKGGPSEKQVDEAIAAIKTEYLGMDIAAFVERATVGKLSFKDFEKLVAESEAVLKKQVSSVDKKKIKGGVERARATVLKIYTPYARRAFAARKTIDSYLRGCRVLDILASNIAVSEQQKAVLAAEREAVAAVVKKRLTGFDFSYDDYPLRKIDLRHLKQTKPSSSLTLCRYLKIADEWAYIIPNTTPHCTGIDGVLEMPFTVVFKRYPLQPMDYSVMILAISNRRLFKHYIPCPFLCIKNAHGEVRFRTKLGMIQEELVGFAEGGGRYILLYLAARERAASDAVEPGEWVPVSLGCKIVVKEPPPPEPEPEPEPTPDSSL